MADDASQLLEERFDQMPEAVQSAITSTDVDAHMRKLAQKHDLHLDQWQELETEVMMALMGIKPVSQLQENIKKNVRVDDGAAKELSDSISSVVLSPIREELERFLSHPSAKPKEGEPIEDLTGEILARADGRSGAITHPPLEPAAGTAEPKTTTTSAAPKPVEEPKSTAIRKEVPETYKSGIASAERKDVHSDPYRETPDS